jgi:hypothetical protein
VLETARKRSIFLKYIFAFANPLDERCEGFGARMNAHFKPSIIQSIFFGLPSGQINISINGTIQPEESTNWLIVAWQQSMVRKYICFCGVFS